MAVRKVLPHTDPILRQIAAPVDLNDPELPALIADLRDTMSAQAGLGLAAPQIGVSKRVFVIAASISLVADDPTQQPALAVINPKITKRSEAMASIAEGCLSMPGATLTLERPAAIDVMFWSPLGVDGALVGVGYTNVDGLAARAFQHEFEHLGGKLFFDQIKDRNRRARFLAQYKQRFA